MTEEHKVRFMFEGSSLLGCCEALLFAQYLLLLPEDCFVSYIVVWIWTRSGKWKAVSIWEALAEKKLIRWEANEHGP